MGPEEPRRGGRMGRGGGQAWRDAGGAHAHATSTASRAAVRRGQAGPSLEPEKAQRSPGPPRAASLVPGHGLDLAGSGRACAADLIGAAAPWGQASG